MLCHNCYIPILYHQVSKKLTSDIYLKNVYRVNISTVSPRVLKLNDAEVFVYPGKNLTTWSSHLPGLTMIGKSTQPVYWGRTVITGRTVVGDMLEWALWVRPIW